MMTTRFAGPDDVPAVKRLNNRLKAGGRQEQVTLNFHLPGEARFGRNGLPVFRRLMVADDGEEIRAALLLYHNSVFIRGDKRDFCWLDMPVSEGIVDRRYSLAIVKLLVKATSYQPFLMSLGVGSLEEDASRFFIKLGWRHGAVPFFFYPVNVTRVLLGLNHLRKYPKLRYAALLGAFSGLGAAVGGLLGLRRRFGLGLAGYEISLEPGFDDWADRVFVDALGDYGVAVQSDAATLNIMYPPDDGNYIRIRVRRGSDRRDIGWIVVLSKLMQNNTHFGNLQVGTLVNGFARTADVPLLIAAGIRYLASVGADIVVGNFSHKAWVRASRRLGMFSGPSNFYFFVSPGGPLLLQNGSGLEEIHLSRGQGDGMVHLR